MSFFTTFSLRSQSPLLRIISACVFIIILYQLFTLSSRRHVVSTGSSVIPPIFDSYTKAPKAPVSQPKAPGPKSPVSVPKLPESKPKVPEISSTSSITIPTSILTSPKATLSTTDSTDKSSAEYLSKQPFPKRLWQTSKDGALALNDVDKALLQTWINLNPDWRYECITAGTQETYVNALYANDPEIRDFFMRLADPISRSDMVRYMVLYKDGGVYSDSDTRALKPIDAWVPEKYRDSANLVIGVEYDRLDQGRWQDWTMDLQFTTWTILTKPNHPVLLATLQELMKQINDLAAKQKTTMEKVTLEFSEVLDTTGPAMFSRTVYNYLSRHGTLYDWHSFTNMTEPRLIEDILILPITAFGSGQQHSNAGKTDDEGAFVEHTFHGSWKIDHSLAAETKKKELAEEERRKKAAAEEEAKKKAASG